MRILAMDLGCASRTITKTSITVLDTDTGAIERTAVPTSPHDLLGVLRAHQPHRVVLEATRGCGWVVDLSRAAGISEVHIANPMDEAWRNRTSKTDRKDADLLARLSATGQIRLVHVPERPIREWRELIDYRHFLVHQRTRIKNRIKAILINQGISTGRLWNERGMASLAALGKPLAICEIDELWRGALWTEQMRLREMEEHLKTVTKRLDALVLSSEPAKELLKVDGVGLRAAEIVVATIDNPLRFHHRKQIGSYFGLAPRVHQSGNKLQHGRISKTGDALARAVLVEIVHLGTHNDGWIRDTYKKHLNDDPMRRKRAIVATARRLVVRLWAKLRDQRKEHPDMTTLPVAA